MRMRSEASSWRRTANAQKLDACFRRLHTIRISAPYANVTPLALYGVGGEGLQLRDFRLSRSNQRAKSLYQE